MFNSRSRKYRDPAGAVAAGTPVHFRITLPRDLSCSAARLVVEQEGAGTSVLDMFWCGMNGSQREWWECHFTPESPGLYFYYFEARTCRGAQRLSRGRAGSAVFGGTNRWQLTVYQKDFETPSWLEGGVMYQIFPDRFKNSGVPKKDIPAGRTLHETWGEQPVWRPNERGIVTNSDYFGGDLRGIEEKLPYLKDLGVTCLYLNPIFESHSNHRYDTADYSKVDPLLGTEEDLRSLCAAAKQLGIRVILDGVFSHTGSDSVYFNREGRYPTDGAYNSQQSPYYSWYTFRKWPNAYDCWWNFDTLPNVNETNDSYNNYINGPEGHRAEMDEGRGLRLALRRGRRAARPVPGPAPRRGQGPGPPGLDPGGSVGGRLQQVRLRRAPPVPAGPAAGHGDELPLPGRHSGLPAGGGTPGASPNGGDHRGELPAPMSQPADEPHRHPPTPNGPSPCWGASPPASRGPGVAGGAKPVSPAAGTRA